MVRKDAAKSSYKLTITYQFSIESSARGLRFGKTDTTPLKDNLLKNEACAVKKVIAPEETKRAPLDNLIFCADARQELQV